MKREARTMTDNYYALALCILKEEYSIDKSINIIFNGGIPSDRDWSITQEDVADMVRLHASGMSYREISYMYNLTRGATIRRIKHYKEKVGKK